MYMMQQENKQRKKPEMPKKEKVPLKVPLVQGMGKLTFQRGVVTQAVQAEIAAFAEQREKQSSSLAESFSQP